MAEHRPFPPSARRRALARQAGLHAASPLVTGGAAVAAALLAATALGNSAAARLGASLEAACRAAGAASPTAALSAAASPTASAAGSTVAPAVVSAAATAAGSGAATTAAAVADLAAAPAAPAALAAAATATPAPVLSAADLPPALLSLALPVLAAAAIAAAVAHLAQTRAVWLPRRHLPGAPAVERGPGERTRRAAFELTAAAVLGACALGWLWTVAPRLAALPSLPLAGAALVGSALAALAIAWLAAGAIDALLRHAELAQALRMTSADQREDDRLAGTDPRWRAYRAKVAREPRNAVAGATVLVLGDGAAVAIAWDAARRPIPTRTAAGRGPRATQLLGLARRHRVPVHRDPALAAALATDDGPVPAPHWARLAEVIAAVRRS